MWLLSSAFALSVSFLHNIRSGFNEQVLSFSVICTCTSHWLHNRWHTSPRTESSGLKLPHTLEKENEVRQCWEAVPRWKEHFPWMWSECLRSSTLQCSPCSEPGQWLVECSDLLMHIVCRSTCKQQMPCGIVRQTFPYALYSIACIEVLSQNVDPTMQRWRFTCSVGFF